MLLKPHLLVAVLSLAQSPVHAAVQPCPLLGPDVPAPKNLSQSTSFQEALIALEDSIEQAMTNVSDASYFSGNNISFALDIYSIHREKPVWTYFHDAPEYGNATVGVTQIDEDTIFRIGSVSKLLTVYATLIEFGNQYWNEPISKYIPEFAQYVTQHPTSGGLLNAYDFDSVTLHDLASQISGIPRDNALDTTVQQMIQDSLPGLPSVEPVPDNMSSKDCPGASAVPCTRQGYLDNILSLHAQWSSGYQPAYSNLAYGLLALAAENITGQPFQTLFERTLITPLNLTSTLYSPPSSVEGINAVIPNGLNVSAFLDDIRIAAPAGAYYSSIADMRRLGRAMLASTQLPRSITNRWFKPVTFTSDPFQSVGAPWEIFTYAPIDWQGRKVELYTKGGAIGNYKANTVLIPIYNVGFTVLTAGASGAVDVLSDMIAETILPALEKAGREEAAQRYAGTFTDPSTNSSITIEVPTSPYNESGPGLHMTSYTYQGFDAKNLYAFLLRSTNPVDYDIRLYPSENTNANGTVDQWWAVPYSKSQQESYAKRKTIMSASACWEWFGLSGLTYGRATIDDFQIRLDADGNAVGITPRVWNTEYLKV